ncbi:hypothetical protein ELQ88_17240 [Pseudomonas sp. MPC6]|nr:hypothetical protein ELQ88_17240 [Pseudomonas sp. MPC6]
MYRSVSGISTAKHGIRCSMTDGYNCERPHQSLKYKTPDAVHRALG